MLNRAVRQAVIRGGKMFATGVALGNAAMVTPTEFPAVLELSDLNGTNGFVITGRDASDLTGWSVSGGGDSIIHAAKAA